MKLSYEQLEQSYEQLEQVYERLKQNYGQLKQDHEQLEQDLKHANEKIAKLEKLLTAALDRITTLEAQINRNSKNSSQPPSSEI